MFKGLGNLTNLLKQAQNVGGRMQAINDQLRMQRVSGTAGGGMVKVEVNGLGEVLKLTIEPALVENGEREMIEDLVPAAMNQAQAKAKQLHGEAIKSLAEGIDIPGLGDAIARFASTDGVPPSEPS